MTATTQNRMKVALALTVPAGQHETFATDTLPRGLTPASATPVKVSRPVTPWRWTNVLLGPLEALALAWSIPFLILLVMVPVGLALASALWFGRLLLRP